MNTINFTSKVYITTTESLKELLHSCKQCSKITNIITRDMLTGLKIKKSIDNKSTIIINTLTATEEKEIGHWVTMCIDWKSREAILVNSLKQIDNSLTKTVKKFCKVNHLNFHIINLGSQQKLSNNCGYHCKFVIHTFHLHGIKRLFKIRRIFDKFSAKTIENFVKKNLI